MYKRYKTRLLGKHTKIYNVWRSMNNRCYCESNTTYKNYGKKGITVLWISFEEFMDDMYESYLDHVEKYGEKETTIDRINNSLGYSKENCRRATYKEQANNRSNNVKTIVKNKKYLVDIQDPVYIKLRKKYGKDMDVLPLLASIQHNI